MKKGERRNKKEGMRRREENEGITKKKGEMRKQER